MATVVYSHVADPLELNEKRVTGEKLWNCWADVDEGIDAADEWSLTA